MPGVSFLSILPSIVVMLFLGLLAATDLVLALAPQTEKLLEQIKPYKGWIGISLALWGAWDTFYYLRWFFTILDLMKIAGFTLFLFWLTGMVAALLQLGVGFLVGFETLASLTGKRDQLEQIRERVAPYEYTLGITALGMAIWYPVAWLLFL
jgi:hypothetical protein